MIADHTRRPLVIDLYAGLGGWAEGFLAEGWDVIGFDIERHVYGEHRYPGQLVIQDVTTLHGSQFKGAVMIVGSSPCQEFSYRAMPWKRAKALGPPELGMKLFNAQFRIQREACEAAGHHIPLIVENVRGAQPWVGRARWNYGSFYLWGDVPALMPITFKASKVPGFRFDGSGKSFQTASCDSVKVGGIDFNGYGTPGYKAVAFNGIAERRLREDIKNTGGSWFNVAHNTTSGKGRNPYGRDPMWKRGFTATAADHMKVGNDWFGVGNNHSPMRQHSSKSSARKFASAMIAKIPEPLSRYIAKVYYPVNLRLTRPPTRAI